MLAMPLWKIANNMPSSSPDIILPDYNSIKKQVKLTSDTSTVNSFRYSLDKTKLLLDVNYLHDGQEWSTDIIYEMDEFGRFFRTSISSYAKQSFPA